MARVPYLEPSDLAPEDQDLLKRPIWLFKALVNSPGAARAFAGLGHYIRYGSKLDSRLRELAILQVGWLARSPYEWSHHVKLGQDFGVSEADIQALIDDTAGKPTGLDALARTVLRAAREITADGAMAEATFTALQAELGNEQAVDLTLTIAFYNAVVRVPARCRSTSNQTTSVILNVSRCRPERSFRAGRQARMAVPGPRRLF